MNISFKIMIQKNTYQQILQLVHNRYLLITLLYNTVLPVKVKIAYSALQRFIVLLFTYVFRSDFFHLMTGTAGNE
jgi:hypothetical protein